MSAAPGSAKGFLIVSDIEAAREQLVAAGTEVSEFFHDGPEGRAGGLHPERLSYHSRASFSDPDGNVWQLQEVTTWRAYLRVRRPLTASTRSALGSATRTGPSGTPATSWLNRPAKNCRNERLRRDGIAYCAAGRAGGAPPGAAPRGPPGPPGRTALVSFRKRPT
jgi:hypothetical protein